ncbi:MULTISPECIES: guanine deaminase [Aerococcus]|uniref:guanine deaminase n=1 Tax=Aerococcus TaxID=1375 RepID=UPI000DCCFA40|nr:MULTISPECIES: guanine deaminase [Aerococcus]KAA9298811.1 guanine deaminase [Aerococcus tenax]MDK6688768.1 guanine deaminase [Aerococcus urinae]MDK8132955.1 guanine deaminase [Aerococcus urinae]MDK8484607.1 guanine deaminase [Aerococcus urinae]MDL5179454.1 guanine deaminase [Aerococcus tenax]
MTQYFQGDLFHTPVYGQLDYVSQALITVDDNGKIDQVYRQEDPAYSEMVKQAQESTDFVRLEAGQYFLPGLVDLHIHAPQWPQAGIALDEPLNVWLDECTFPLEAKYADLDFARAVYTDLVQQLLARGTTTGLYFASAHLESSYELAKICAQAGQRGLVGKVVMDDPEANPDFYRDASTDQALKDTETFIQKVRQLGKDYKQGVYPVVTPRFVPSCTDDALAGLGELAQKYQAHVQSHCSEGQWEHDFVMERFQGKRDTEVLRDFGLLGPKSVMAHCNFLNEADGKIFQETGTGIGHCPYSNAYFANAVLPVKRLKAQGVNIGLGTDISGGFSPSLYENIRQAVVSSRILEDGVDTQVGPDERGVSDSRISLVEAFYLATKGGGESLDLPLGSIESGQACDLQLVDTKVANNILPDFGVFNDPREIFERIIYLVTPENIRKVWVQGDLVVDKEIFSK